MREVEGVELYEDRATEAVDLSRPMEPMPPEMAAVDGTPEDPFYDAEEESRPEPKSRAEAVGALADALDEMLADESLRDPKDPTGQTVIIGPGMTGDRYRFRSRPWFSEEYAKLAEGRGELADRYVMALAEDLGLKEGKYRLRRVGNAE